MARAHYFREVTFSEVSAGVASENALKAGIGSGEIRSENAKGAPRVRRGRLAGELARVHRARGELQRAHEIETDLLGELEQIRALIDGWRPDRSTVEPRRGNRGRRADTRSARAPTRKAAERPVGVEDAEAVKRLIDHARSRPPRLR
jgi:hypothetical protein